MVARKYNHQQPSVGETRQRVLLAIDSWQLEGRRCITDRQLSKPGRISCS
jgi:hypothetical protein